MQDHWRRQGPPVYLTVAAYLGYKPPKETVKRGPGTEADREKAFEELFASFSSSGGVIHG